MSARKVGRLFVYVGVAGAASYTGYHFTKNRYTVSEAPCYVTARVT